MPYVQIISDHTYDINANTHDINAIDQFLDYMPKSRELQTQTRSPPPRSLVIGCSLGYHQIPLGLPESMIQLALISFRRGFRLEKEDSGGGVFVCCRSRRFVRVMISFLWRWFRPGLVYHQHGR